MSNTRKYELYFFSQTHWDTLGHIWQAFVHVKYTLGGHNVIFETWASVEIAECLVHDYWAPVD